MSATGLLLLVAMGMAAAGFVAALVLAVCWRARRLSSAAAVLSDPRPRHRPDPDGWALEIPVASLRVMATREWTSAFGLPPNCSGSFAVTPRGITYDVPWRGEQMGFDLIEQVDVPPLAQRFLLTVQLRTGREIRVMAASPEGVDAVLHELAPRVALSARAQQRLSRTWRGVPGDQPM